jgi:hypothetical protein
VCVEIPDRVSVRPRLPAGREAGDDPGWDSGQPKQQRRRAGEVLAVARVSTQQEVGEGLRSGDRHLGGVPEAAAEQEALDSDHFVPFGSRARLNPERQRSDARVDERPRRPLGL